MPSKKSNKISKKKYNKSNKKKYNKTKKGGYSKILPDPESYNTELTNKIISSPNFNIDETAFRFLEKLVQAVRDGIEEKKY